MARQTQKQRAASLRNLRKAWAKTNKRKKSRRKSARKSSRRKSTRKSSRRKGHVVVTTKQIQRAARGIISRSACATLVKRARKHAKHAGTSHIVLGEN